MTSKKNASRPVRKRPSQPTPAAPAVSAPLAIDIGLTESERKQVAQSLDKVLADAFTLYLMTHQFHWNVTGPMFNALHTMFEQQYTEQWAALDEIAERIRALGFPAPGSFAELGQLTSIKCAPGLSRTPDWKTMVTQLLEANEAVCRTARAASEVADDVDDEATEDLMTQRLQVHEKNAWMLRSLLQ